MSGSALLAQHPNPLILRHSKGERAPGNTLPYLRRHVLSGLLRKFPGFDYASPSLSSAFGRAELMATSCTNSAGIKDYGFPAGVVDWRRCDYESRTTNDVFNVRTA
jgi:hypothetical protein